MSRFDFAVSIVLKNEGYGPCEDIKGDQKTHYGIIQDDLDDAISKGIITKDTTLENLILKQAIAIYKELYYDNCPNLDKINSQSVINKILDLRVNIGPQRAIKMAQRAINRLGSYTIAEDGIFGSRTLEAINNTKETFLLNEIRQLQTKYYNDIVNCHPEKVVFIKGWLKRVHST